MEHRIAHTLAEAVANNYGNSITVSRRIPVSGGDINRAYTLELSDGSKLFMKANRKENLGFFKAESEGLEAIRSTGTVKAPAVIAIGTDGNDAFLLLEHIESGRNSRASSAELGESLAHMHLADTNSFVNNGLFGFTADNYIGAGEQINTSKQTWISFFIECRLIPQFERASKYFERDERRKVEVFLSRIDQYLIEPEHPSLLHGDLWSGNYMIDSEGHPWLIDPAAYVGHAEADFAMTELFGGFDRYFYDAYKETAGIDPGYRDRKDLYNLYHLLNHLNLFGGGYLYSVRSVLHRYI